ncbi:MAG: MFS transporter [Clostridia bacterium]|nr:MFS transporter [Clostridia bacterium]
MVTAAVFTTHQKHAIISLSMALALRMFGVSLFLPVLSIYAQEFTNNGHLIGVALGVYGLVQAVFQVPVGMMSDRIGRKRVILIGLFIFILGSILAAVTTNILVLILARAMQGAGAISGAVYAYIADVIERDKRSRAMALIGMPFGIAFSIGIVLGPMLGHWWGIPALFWLCAGLVTISATYVYFAIEERTALMNVESKISISEVFSALRQPGLFKLNLGGFITNFYQTSILGLFLPSLAQNYVALNQFWKIMVPMVAIGTVVMLWSAKKTDSGRSYAMAKLAFILLSASAVVLMLPGFPLLIIGAILFFTGFSMTQPLLSTAVTMAANQRLVGTTSGLYNMSQFIGTFFGGAIGGFFLHNIPVFLVILFLLGMLGVFTVAGAIKQLR